MPPEEEFHGQASANDPPPPPPVGLPHGRFWDIHIWLGKDGVPTLSILNPSKPIPGLEAKIGIDFFYPRDEDLPGAPPPPWPPPGQY